MVANGLSDVAALIFNTHGESMGRGAHPTGFEDRLSWPLSLWARRRFVRAGIRLDANWQAWEGQVEWVQVARQNRVAEFETATPGYGMLNLGVSYNGQFSSGTPWQVYLKANNLTDRLAYAHTSFIKNAAPLMGRNLTVGVKVAF